MLHAMHIYSMHNMLQVYFVKLKSTETLKYATMRMAEQIRVHSWDGILLT